MISFKKLTSSLLPLALISFTTFISQPVYSTETTETVKDLCAKSNDDLKTLSAAVQDFVNGKLKEDQLLTKVTEVDTYWNEKIRNNSCNSYRSNPITCPDSSESMKQLAIADSVKAMLTSINFQVDRKYAASEVKQFFSNGVQSHQKLCKEKISN